MGGAVARGLAKGSLIQAPDIYVSNPSTAKLDALKRNYPTMHTTTDNRAVVADADVVILAVKPWKVEVVLEEIKPVLDYERQAVASMVGGRGFAQLDEWLDKGDGLLPATYLLCPKVLRIA